MTDLPHQLLLLLPAAGPHMRRRDQMPTSGGACRSLARPRGGSVFIFYRAQPARWISFYFLPRAACTVEIMFYFCRAAAARCWILIRPPRRACAAADLTGRHRADPTRRTFCRADPVMRFVFLKSKVCTHKYLGLKLAPSTKSNAYGRTAKYCRWVLPSPP